MKRPFVSPLPLVLLLALAVAASLACQGQVVPLSMQAGSTVLVPLSAETHTGNIGYGGTLAEDYQRGTLVFQLDGPGGFELETRASSAVIASPGAAVNYNPVALKRQIISLLDIPFDAPLGTHSLHVVRRRIEGGVPVDHAGPSYPGEITILPPEITFDVDGVPETAYGDSTPFKWGNGTTWQDLLTTTVQQAIPRPELRIVVSPAVSALELQVDFPASVIDVVDAFEPPTTVANHLASVWLTPVSSGTVRVSAVAPSAAFTAVSLVFTLDNGAAVILDPAQVNVVIDGAWNQAGSPVSTSVTSKLIY